MVKQSIKKKRGTTLPTTIVDRVRFKSVYYPDRLPDIPLDAIEFATPRNVKLYADNGVRYEGRLPIVDTMHVYQLAVIVDGRNDSTKKIAGVQTVDLVVLDQTNLVELLTKHKILTAEAAANVVARLTPLARSGHCGALLRECGAESWYITLETRIPKYFVDFYINVLSEKTVWCDSPPFEKAGLASFSADKIFTLARTAATAPWTVCFWWLHNIPVLKDISAAASMSLAFAFGVIDSKGAASDANSARVTAQLAKITSVYSSGILGRARDSGESFVPYNDFVRDVGQNNTGVIKEMLRMGLIKTMTIVKNGDVNNYVIAVGDELCEKEVTSTIISRVTTGDDADVELTPMYRRWPECDGSTPKPELNDEQRVAVDAIVSRRFSVVIGKPGVGKTKFVMRSVVSAFDTGQVVAVAFTGLAVKRMQDTFGIGYTAHRIIASWISSGSRHDAPGYKFGNFRVLIVEEASTMSLLLMRMLLRALGPSLRRIYLFGDYRQIEPQSGSSILAALKRRYENTPILISLNRSMRVTEGTGAYIENLDNICEWNGTERWVSSDPEQRPPPLMLKWSPDPRSNAPFIFLNRGRDCDETVMIIRSALEASSVDPDGSEFQIVVHTGKQELELGKCWYLHSRVHTECNKPYRHNDFTVGERVLFRANQYGSAPNSSVYHASDVMNGTIGTIDRIFDEDLFTGQHQVIDVTDTDSPPSFKTNSIRWIHIAPPYDCYYLITPEVLKNITRAQPATVIKMQGQEARVIVVYLAANEEWNYTRRELYTACSRGRARCIVVGGRPADLVQNDHNVSSVCPDPKFASIVAGSSVYVKNTLLHKWFPEFSAIDNATLATAVTPTRLVPRKRAAPQNHTGNTRRKKKC